MRAACYRFLSRKLACGDLTHGHNTLALLDFLATSAVPSRQAGWGKSGSKLHALQSIAPQPEPDSREAGTRGTTDD
ncbi:MAG: hypothetical protein ACLQVL_08950 [Terriglobia bacterium]